MTEPQQETALVAPAPKPLGQFPQLPELRNSEDDWTGITETADRRRRQNRLNQRAYRKRKARNEELAHVTPEEAYTNGILILSTPRDRAVAYAFLQVVQMQHSLKNHRPALLPSLIRLNAINAISNNALHIGLPLKGLCCDDLISPWNALGPEPADNNATIKSSCPESLRPTSLQSEIEHHPWVDLLPIPRLRENMIKGYSSGVFDEDELCVDLLGLTSSKDLDEAYLIVWGESHEANNWEDTLFHTQLLQSGPASPRLVSRIIRDSSSAIIGNPPGVMAVQVSVTIADEDV
ncbi:hypothetical protein FSARC_13494 [Fusarium sarcochroum]|uniref:BZIP domain-containing protein n=1 Tax=Fusarium sarcochroum TaxID=1208366 RepID=A0A8H4T0Y4_9HYPO|nr:hypothetical protein FSARC_13494 [Fusarium sarcochroum]